jgi:predicted RNA methylase
VKTHLTLSYERSDLPGVDASDDVRTPEPLVEHLVSTFSDPGDVVFDPFAGFGTTLVVAESLDRESYGVEIASERVARVRERLDVDDPRSRVCHGDVREFDPTDVPPVDLCVTSPPFMGQERGVDPFENYESRSETTYEAYLGAIAAAFGRVEGCLAPDSRVVVDVANVKTDEGVRPLAWDVGRAVADVFDFRGEIVVAWEGVDDGAGVYGYGYGYDHSYCLVYDA